MFHVKHSLVEGLKELGIAADEKKLQSLIQYIEELIQWNDRINLFSRRLNKEELTERLILPSLIPYKVIRMGEKLLDFGAGAGLVGIPLAIILPEVSIDLLESTAKKATFLRHIRTTLSLDIGIINQFISNSKDLKHRYDTVLARAVNPEGIPPGISKRIIYYGEYKGDKLKLDASIEWKNWKISILLAQCFT